MEIYKQFVLFTKENSLAKVYPKVEEIWDFEKNLGITPDKYSVWSNKEVHLKCPVCKHEWIAKVSSIASSMKHNSPYNGCPICSNMKTVASINSLAVTHPQYMIEWHPSLNGSKTPYDYTAGSGEMIWWTCDKGEHREHVWLAGIESRTRKKGTSCPICCGQLIIEGENDLPTKRPDVATQWHPTLNGELKVTEVGPNTNKKVWWLCDQGIHKPHVWQAWINNRTGRNTQKGSGCPICSNQKLLVGENDLETVESELAELWDYGRNGDKKPSDYLPSAKDKVYWIDRKKPVRICDRVQTIRKHRKFGKKND